MATVIASSAGTAAPDPRIEQIHHWLATLPAALGIRPATLQPASSDASFRRYFRIDADDGTLIVMDAPPGKEDCRPFVHVAGLLRAAGLNVPAILAQDLDRGLLLLSDLGHTTYYEHLRTAPGDAAIHGMYMDALDALVAMQHSATTGLQPYDQPRMNAELDLFPVWYADRHCGAPLDAGARADLQAVFDTLLAACVAQPSVLIHRDFHSPNLMLTDGGRTGRNPGVIDFQDAVVGPITYDLASLLTDARTTWDEAQQLDWGIRYWEKARRAGLPVDADFADFHRAYEWMGLQRNLRILGVFARLAWRDDKRGYLDHMPRVNGYVRQVAGRYHAFLPLIRLLDRLDNRQAAVGYTF